MTATEAACLLAGLIVGAALTVVGLWIAGAFDNWTTKQQAAPRLRTVVPNHHEDIAMPETGEFHHRDGWYFKRLDDGSVRIRKTVSTHTASTTAVEHIIPPNEWVSVVAHVSGGEVDLAARHSAAAKLHNTNEPRHD